MQRNTCENLMKYAIQLEKDNCEIIDEYYSNINDQISLLFDANCRKVSELEVLFYYKFRITIDRYNVNKKWWDDLIIKWQVPFKDGKYIVDYYLEFRGLKIIIELDGFAFHDRNKEQFQYERERQNYFTKQDYKLLRYTWKDVSKNFDKIFAEIEDLLVKHDINEFQKEYDRKNK